MNIRIRNILFRPGVNFKYPIVPVFKILLSIKLQLKMTPNLDDITSVFS